MNNDAAPATRTAITQTDTIARLPKSRRPVYMITDADARITVGRQSTVHRGSVAVEYNAFDEPIGTNVFGIACGSDRRRGGRSSFTKQSKRYDVDCSKCIAAATS